MTINEQRTFAKAVLESGGVKVSKKDIKSCENHRVTNIEHANGEGLEPDIACHREIINIVMMDGTRYEVLRETVDKDGNFSTVSAKWEVKEVRKNDH